MKKNVTSKTLLLILCLLSITSFTTVVAQQTKKISLQGFLKDANGKAVADGAQDIIFKLYTTEAGGTAAWTENQTINIYGGVYSTHLGKTVSLDNLSWGTKTYYVGVTVQGTELTPRTELTFAPYSLGSPRANLADTAKVVKCSGAVGDVKYSILKPEQFALVNGDCWVPMDGRALAATDRLRQITNATALPNAGGLFLRSQEYGASDNDPERIATSPIATPQSDDFKLHTHTLTINSDGAHSHSLYLLQDKSAGDGDGGNNYFPDNSGSDGTGYFGETTSAGGHNHPGSTIADTGGRETRPKNLNLYIYIRIN